MTEQFCLDNIASAQAAYEAVVGYGTVAEIEAAAAAAVAAKESYSAFLSDGAQACPNCGAMPAGMRKSEIGGLPIYQVGCVNCAAFLNADGKRQSWAARGFTPVLAVDAWNSGAYLVDERIDLLS